MVVLSGLAWAQLWPSWGCTMAASGCVEMRRKHLAQHISTLVSCIPRSTDASATSLSQVTPRLR